MSRAQRRRLVRQLREGGIAVQLPADLYVIWAEIGPPPRWRGQPGYEERMTNLRAYVRHHWDAIMARAEPGWMPWCWWRWSPDAPARWRDSPPPMQSPEQTRWLRQQGETR